MGGKNIIECVLQDCFLQIEDLKIREISNRRDTILYSAFSERDPKDQFAIKVGVSDESPYDQRYLVKREGKLLSSEALRPIPKTELIHRGTIGGNLASYIVTKWIEGTPLHKIEDDRLLDAVLQVLEIIAQFHEAGYVHGDIQPSHFAQTADEDVVVFDLGLTHSISGDFDSLHYKGAHIAYASPEVAVGMLARANRIPYSNQSEIYSIGAMLYYLWFGKTLIDFQEGATFADKIQATIDGCRRDFSAPVRDMRPGIAATIEKCTRYNPSARYQNIQAVREEVHKLARETAR